MTVDFVTFGIILDDIVFADGHTAMGVLGGGGAQTAWGMAAALGDGRRVGLVSGVGYDISDSMLTPLHRANIDLNGVRTTDRPTPRAWQLQEADDRRNQVWRISPEHIGAQLQRHWDVIPEAYQDAQHFHWGVHVSDGVPELVHQLNEQQKQVSLEPFRVPPKTLTIEERQAFLASCFVFSPTAQELNAIMGTTDVHYAVEACQQAGTSYLTIRKGEHGATVYDFIAGKIINAPALPVTVVDEMGAGNAFCGGFLAKITKGDSHKATCHAIAAASYMVEQVGLPPRLPDQADYQQRLNTIRENTTIRDL